MSNLDKLRVMVTRPQPQGMELCRLIDSCGGQAVSFPTIEFAPPTDVKAFQQAILLLGEQDGLIFISPQAVYASVTAIREVWRQFPLHVQFAAVGAGTANAMQEAGFTQIIYPSHDWSSEGLLDLPEFQNITHKLWAIISGEGGRDVLEKTLIARGAHVLPVIAYQRVLPQVDPAPYLALFKQYQIDVVVCASYESIRNLKILLGKEGWPFIRVVTLVVMSERLKVLAQDLGFQTICVARNASHKAVLDALVDIRG